MRQIIFRGKRKDNGKWIYGWYIKANIHWHKYGVHKDWIVCNAIQNGGICNVIGRYAVIPETVGQYTGLTDKNGNRIFEGDIVVTRYINGEICSIGDIQFDYGVFGAEWTIHKEHKTMVGCWGQLHNLRRLDDDIINHIEVIGNIYDNPELLEVGV